MILLKDILKEGRNTPFQKLKSELATEGYLIIFEQPYPKGIITWRIEVKDYHPDSKEFYINRLKQLIGPYARGQDVLVQKHPIQPKIFYTAFYPNIKN